nr:zinc finger BED domain-containing protein RICESLEEPER 2-like [Ipomoea batatas]GMC75860.1 zinc finger BED domain-containing protein RICESLEEPER 2-like [Ipomoea batatas]
MLLLRNRRPADSPFRDSPSSLHPPPAAEPAPPPLRLRPPPANQHRDPRRIFNLRECTPRFAGTADLVGVGLVFAAIFVLFSKHLIWWLRIVPAVCYPIVLVVMVVAKGEGRVIDNQTKLNILPSDGVSSSIPPLHHGRVDMEVVREYIAKTKVSLILY